MIKEIFLNSIIPSAKMGSIIIKEKDDYTDEIIDFTYNIRYDKEYTNDMNIPTLKIRNEKQFYELLEKYITLVLNLYPKYDQIELTEYVKKILGLLFVNATYDDFLSPELYLQKRISFLERPLYTDSIINIDDFSIEFNNHQQSIMLETPNCLVPVINTGDKKVVLPKISYGIYNDVCYIYSIQNIKNENHVDGVNFNQLLKKDKSQIDDEYGTYYKNKLRNVTSSFVLSSTILFKLLEEQGITDIKIVPFLPVRYSAKRCANKNRAKNKTTSIKEYSDTLLELNNNQIELQKNITNKFLRTFDKIEYMTDFIHIDLNPYEYDDLMHIKLNEMTRCDNKLLWDIISYPMNTVINVK